MDIQKLSDVWRRLEEGGFECITATDPRDALDNYFKQWLAIRFALKGAFIPNFKLKFPKSELNRYSLRNRVRVEVNGHVLWTSVLELQIAYKLNLGSGKDIEDAKHLWLIFKEYIDKEAFLEFARKLRVEDKIGDLEQ